MENILQQITESTGHLFNNPTISPVGGGCINQAYQVRDGELSYFIKTNQPQLLAMFEAEAAGLIEMKALNAVRVPAVICSGLTDKEIFLVLEHIPLTSLRGQAAGLLGEQLARMHRHQQPFFGWHQNNTIGSTPQINDRSHDWVTFWSEQRIGQQLTFAASNGFAGRLQQQGERLMADMALFFTDHQPSPSLLHGDLWGGNASADENGQPVIYDPACYYGDREADLAMTELFGGFGHDFWAAYHAEYPVDAGYRVRKTLYNLYHILNHLNLFGGGYLGQAESMINSLLAELR
jgi:fructosamine-3-kinase